MVALAVEEDLAIILDNLIENALHYSPEGSAVTIEFGREGDDAYLAVLDDGPGIAPGEEEAVFERFRRGSASKSSSGTGLGLAIVQTLAQRWGGRASLSREARGRHARRDQAPAGDALPTPNPDLDEPDRRPLLDWVTSMRNDADTARSRARRPLRGRVAGLRRVRGLARPGRAAGDEAQDAAGLARPHSGEDDEAAGAATRKRVVPAATASTSEHDDPGAGRRPRRALARRLRSGSGLAAAADDD